MSVVSGVTGIVAVPRIEYEPLRSDTVKLCVPSVCRMTPFAKKIAATYGIPHIATGDMIREMMERPTELGAELREVYDRGDLVSDDLMIRCYEAHTVATRATIALPR